MCMETEGETESVNFAIPIHKHTCVCTSRDIHSLSRSLFPRVYHMELSIIFYLLDILITFYSFARVCDTHISSNILLVNFSYRSVH